MTEFGEYAERTIRLLAAMEKEREAMVRAEITRRYPEMLPSVPQWVCLCCALVTANGECCATDSHGGDGIEPLSNIPDGAHVAMGMSYDNHDDTCLKKKLSGQRWPKVPDNYECDCETRTFSHSQCDGCGSFLAGERHAVTIFSPAEDVETSH